MGSMTEQKQCSICLTPIHRDLHMCWPCFDNHNRISNRRPCSLCHGDDVDSQDGAPRLPHGTRYCRSCAEIFTPVTEKEIQAALTELQEWVT